jgi:hypothetical protein
MLAIFRYSTSLVSLSCQPQSFPRHRGHLLTICSRDFLVPLRRKSRGLTIRLFGCARAAISGRSDGGLAVEVRCRLIRAQILEHGAQAVATANFLRRDGVAAVHVNQEFGIRCEKGHLPLNVPAICAVSILRRQAREWQGDRQFPAGVRPLWSDRCIETVNCHSAVAPPPASYWQ